MRVLNLLNSVTIPAYFEMQYLPKWALAAVVIFWWGI